MLREIPFYPDSKDCEAARMKYGRDVYLHSRQMGDAKVGELISFTIVRNGKGEPQAERM